MPCPIREQHAATRATLRKIDSALGRLALRFLSDAIAPALRFACVIGVAIVRVRPAHFMLSPAKNIFATISAIGATSFAHRGAVSASNCASTGSTRQTPCRFS